MARTNASDDLPVIRTGAGRRERRSENVMALEALDRGQSRIIRFSGKTPFGVWIAIQRERLGANFRWKAGSATKTYVVWLKEARKPLTIAKASTFGPRHDLLSIDWERSKLSSRDLNAVNEALDAYRFAPRRGPGGSILTRVASRVGVSKQTVQAKLERLSKPGGKLAERLEPSLRRVLSAFVTIIASSSQTWFHRGVTDELKAAKRNLNKGKPASIRLVASRPEFESLMRGFKRRDKHNHIKAKWHKGSPGSYTLTVDEDF